MSKLQIEIADLESILTNCRDDHTPEELAEMEENLVQYSYLERLWEQFRAVPVADGVLLADFHPEGPDGTPSPSERRFSRGECEGRVLAWFQSRFCVDVREDLGYDGPWDLPGKDVPAQVPIQALEPGPTLSAAQREQVYLSVRAEKLAEDAKAHAEALLAEDPALLEGLCGGDYARMARKFMECHDPSRPDDEQWDEIVWETANRGK